VPHLSTLSGFRRSQSTQNGWINTLRVQQLLSYSFWTYLVLLPWEKRRRSLPTVFPRGVGAATSRLEPALSLRLMSSVLPVKTLHAPMHASRDQVLLKEALGLVDYNDWSFLCLSPCVLNHDANLKCFAPNQSSPGGILLTSLCRDASSCYWYTFFPKSLDKPYSYDYIIRKLQAELAYTEAIVIIIHSVCSYDRPFFHLFPVVAWSLR